MSKSVLTFTQKLRIMSVLELVRDVIVSDGYCYIPGHSDATVAAEMEFECTDHNVAGLRRELFGNIVQPPASSLEERVAVLEKAVRELLAA